MASDDCYRVRGPQVISEIVEGELVMINLERGIYYSADKTGAAIWKMVEQGLSHAEIVAATRAAFDGDPVEIAAAVEAFVGRMLDEELIMPSEQPTGTGSTADAVAPDNWDAFEPPVLHVYSDMADILLLDPVHDVGETGWPTPRSGSDPE